MPTPEILKLNAITFFNWVDDNCIKSIEGWFFTDPLFAENYSYNEYSVEDLYDIYVQAILAEQ